MTACVVWCATGAVLSCALEQRGELRVACAHQLVVLARGLARLVRLSYLLQVRHTSTAARARSCPHARAREVRSGCARARGCGWSSRRDWSRGAWPLPRVWHSSSPALAACAAQSSPTQRIARSGKPTACVECSQVPSCREYFAPPLLGLYPCNASKRTQACVRVHANAHGRMRARA